MRVWRGRSGLWAGTHGGEIELLFCEGYCRIRVRAGSARLESVLSSEKHVRELEVRLLEVLHCGVGSYLCIGSLAQVA